jgi:enoyl-CoA hydratase/carnithine racemase
MHWTTLRQGRVAILTFTRPPINMMSFAAAGELLAALTVLEKDKDISIVVLTGGVPLYFVAHADLEDIGRMARRETPQGDPENYVRAMTKLESMPQPTIAAVNGQAWGGGFEIALCCTLRLAARSANFRLHEVSKGAIPGGGGTQRLPRLVGVGKASAMILASQLVKAEQAVSIGLAEAVLPDANFIDHVMTWLQPMIEQPPHALFAAKRAIIDGLRMPLEAGLANERRLFAEAISAEAFADR